jgi:hypothetical protein
LNVADGRGAKDGVLPIEVDAVDAFAPRCRRRRALREAKCSTLVRARLVHDLDVFTRIQQVELLVDLLRAAVRAHAEAHAIADAAALRGDQNDAVRPARAVDRGRRGVLEDVDALDFIRIDARDRRLPLSARRQLLEAALNHRDAVDDVERLIAGVERARSAHAHRDRAAGLTGVLHHLYAGDLALEGVVDADDGNVSDRHRVDRRDRARDVRSARCTVADRHDLGERDGDRRHGEVDAGRRAGGHRGLSLLPRKTDALHRHGDGTGRNAGDRVVSLFVREVAARVAGDRHLRGDDGSSTAGILDDPFDSAGLLRLCRRRGGDRSEHERQDHGEGPSGAEHLHARSPGRGTLSERSVDLGHR